MLQIQLDPRSALALAASALASVEDVRAGLQFKKAKQDAHTPPPPWHARCGTAADHSSIDRFGMTGVRVAVTKKLFDSVKHTNSLCHQPRKQTSKGPVRFYLLSTDLI